MMASAVLRTFNGSKVVVMLQLLMLLVFGVLLSTTRSFTSSNDKGILPSLARSSRTWATTSPTPTTGSTTSRRMISSSSTMQKLQPRQALILSHISYPYASSSLRCSSNGGGSCGDIDPWYLPSLVLTSTTEIESSWVQPVAFVLDPTLNFLAFAMLCRVIISWYPTQNINDFPLNVVSWPTEPLLKLLRPIIPPAFGVDITPIVWFGIFTFLHEILLGQQGLFTMKMKYWS